MLKTIGNTIRAGIWLLLPAVACSAPDLVKTIPGVVQTPYPTLENITVEWFISGDANLDGVVSVRFRAEGESQWRDNMPLRRVLFGENGSFKWQNRHSGSVFNLRPGTRYEIELDLVDPDGGSARKMVSVATRPVPQPSASGTVQTVTPDTLSRALRGASPGDILELQPGRYSGFTIGRDGAPGKPIVVRGTPGADIVGELGVFSQNHVMLDQLSIVGRIRFNGSNNMTITRCRVQAAKNAFNSDGIVAFGRSENAYIADNVVIGTTVWEGPSLGAKGNNRGEGIQVTGPGHVIMNNKVTRFRDNISLAEDDNAVDQFSIDILNNELSIAADDAIEADFCFHNCRIMRNRVTNGFVAFSSQPSLGGPNYFVRNVAYNVPFLAFKLLRGSTGDVLLHNSVVKSGDALGMPGSREVARLLTRNNLFYGGPGERHNGYHGGSGMIIRMKSLVLANSSLDYDAFGTAAPKLRGVFGLTRFKGMTSFKNLTTERNAVQIGLDDFASSVAYPHQATEIYAAPDLRLAPSSAAVDGGQSIDNINDGYSGDAPDIGAYELGQPMPHYGPRIGRNH